MKVFFTLALFFLLQNFQAEGSGISESSKPFIVSCNNVFEWQFNYDTDKASIGFGLTGLGSEDKLEFLYNADHLYYHPEIKNSALDFTSTNSWEFRISVSFSIWNLFQKK